ncbi:AsmA family protein [Pseudooceanicola sp. MF1-13]|uniref:AsmA family protein n=1 Tax=Pseudooceanicola sp. MF1-13 TaxID=3379095 RepID=UPI003892CABA
MRLIRLLIGMVLVFVLVFIAGLFLVPGEKIAQVAADEIERRTGREVQIGGEARFTLWPNLGVTVDTLRIANADWSENGPMFQAKSVTIGVDAAALIRRDIKIRALHADAPEILLERNDQGTGNWELSPVTASAAGSATGSAPAAQSAPVSQPASRGVPQFTLDRAEIADASVYFIDRQAGTELSQRGIDLVLTYPEAGGAADIDLTLRPAGEPVRLTGTLADPMALAGGEITGVSLSIDLPGGEASFEGRASITPEAQGALNLIVSDTAAFAGALGQVPPALPEGLGRDLSLTSQITLTRDGRLSLRDGSVRSGSNSATLAADVTTGGDRPRLNAQVNAGPLDLSAIASGTQASGGSSAGAAQAGWSTAPIDASALGLIDGEIALTAPSIDLGTTQLGTTRVLITIDRSRAVASLREVQVFGGKVVGEFVANNRNGLSVGGDMRAEGIALNQALTELAGVSRFTGDASARVKFLATGQSVAALMNSLSGDGGVQTGKGTIDGIDLDRLFRGGDPTGGTTIFDATNATFTLTDGNLRNDDLLMKLGGIEARGTGRIGLGPQDIDYLFTPISLTARDGRGLALPVLIRGPWAGPKISVDLEKAIELNAAEERKALETQVREKVKAKVEQELGITQQEGESAEDAVRRTIEEEAKKGLLKLLNR